MAEVFPERLARGAARQVYRLLRLSEPLLRPIYQRIGLENRARAVTTLVRFGWNGTAVSPTLARPSEIAAPESLTAGVVAVSSNEIEAEPVSAAGPGDLPLEPRE